MLASDSRTSFDKDTIFIEMLQCGCSSLGKPAAMKLSVSFKSTSARAERSRFDAGPKGAELRLVMSRLPFLMCRVG